MDRDFNLAKKLVTPLVGVDVFIPDPESRVLLIKRTDNGLLWRRHKSNPSELIPEHLWQSAIQQCSIHSRCKVAQTLKLDATYLKKRLSQNLPAESPTPAQFIEIPSSFHNASKGCGCERVELEKRDGSRMKLMAPNGSELNYPPDKIINT